MHAWFSSCSASSSTLSIDVFFARRSKQAPAALRSKLEGPKPFQRRRPPSVAKTSFYVALILCFFVWLLIQSKRQPSSFAMKETDCVGKEGPVLLCGVRSTIDAPEDSRGPRSLPCSAARSWANTPVLVRPAPTVARNDAATQCERWTAG